MRALESILVLSYAWSRRKTPGGVGKSAREEPVN